MKVYVQSKLDEKKKPLHTHTKLVSSQNNRVFIDESVCNCGTKGFQKFAEILKNVKFHLKKGTFPGDHVAPSGVHRNDSHNQMN